MSDYLSPEGIAAYPARRLRSRGHDLSLSNLFQIVTGCGAFFACVRISPAAAIILTLVCTPAIIRTGLISRLFLEQGQSLSWSARIQYFTTSLLIVGLTYALAIIAFALVTMSFGALCGLIAALTKIPADMVRDVSVVGMLGGSVWGIAASIISVSWTSTLWELPTAGTAAHPAHPPAA